VPVQDWLPVDKPVQWSTALRELGRLYRLAHADSDERDLATWAGLALGEERRRCRRRLSELRSEVLADGDRLVHG
jgi:hypothetical protein